MKLNISNILCERVDQGVSNILCEQREATFSTEPSRYMFA